MKNNHKANKHLTYEKRNFIEIAKDISKDRRTIAREIEKHKFKKKSSSFN